MLGTPEVCHNVHFQLLLSHNDIPRAGYHFKARRSNLLDFEGWRSKLVVRALVKARAGASPRTNDVVPEAQERHSFHQETTAADEACFG